jgi:hypothetical protein
MKYLRLVLAGWVFFASAAWGQVGHIPTYIQPSVVPANPFIILNGASLSLSRAAYRNARTGVARMAVLHMGDSTTRGFQGSGNVFTAQNSYIGQLPAFSLSIPQVTTSMFGGDTGSMTNAYDPRFNQDVPVQALGALGGQTWYSTTAGGFGINFEPTTTADTVDAYYISNTGSGNGLINVQGYNGVTLVSTLGQLDCGQAGAMRKATFSFNPATINTIGLYTNTTATVYIQGIDIYNSAAKGISHINAGFSASLAADGANAANPWGSLSGIGVVAAPLVFINYTINDAHAGTSTAAYQASLQAMINAVISAGGDPVLIMGNPTDPSYASAIAQNTIVAAAKATAASNHVPVIDCYSFFGSYANMIANGWGDDPGLVHPDTAGYGQVASLVNLFIKNYVAN